MIGWWTAAAATLLTFLGYVAFFWKINWVRKETISHGAGYSTTKNRKVGSLPPVFPNGWFALLESWQLRKGEVKHVAALGENFAVFRSEKGEVHILNAYCPHLGANLGEGGIVKGDCLECPFHSWLFRGDNGRCEKIPYANKVPEIAKTKAWQCCEVNHIIFVWYHAESAEPDWRPRPVESVNNGSWWNQGRNEFYINSHIQEIPENGADWAHLSAVHGPGMFLKDILPGFLRHSWTGAVWAPHVPQTSSGDKSSVETEADKSDCPKSESHRATMKLKHNTIICDRYKLIELDVTAEQIGPGYVELTLVSSLGTMCILQTVTPLEPLLQRVTHTMFSPPLLGPYAKIVHLGECIMFERDLAVWNHKTFLKRPVLVREDRTILTYRRWFEQFYSANSPTYESVRALDW